MLVAAAATGTTVTPASKTSLASKTQCFHDLLRYFALFVWRLFISLSGEQRCAPESMYYDADHAIHKEAYDHEEEYSHE